MENLETSLGKIQKQMTERHRTVGEFEKELLNNLVTQYFQSGSVDQVMRLNPSSGVSYAELHRELDRRGIVKLKGTGRTSLAHAIFFFSSLLNEKIPLQELYKRHMPPSFKDSISIETLHRIHSYIRKQLVEGLDKEKRQKHRRYGSALLITHPQNEELVLIADDVSPPNDRYGKRYGAVTIPIGFSNKNKYEEGIMRIFQQEVATPFAINGLLRPDSDVTSKVLPKNPRPFNYIDIANVRVATYVIALPEELSDLSMLSSFKLKNYRWVSAYEISAISPSDPSVRSGVTDIVSTYSHIINGDDIDLPVKQPSWLNLQIANLSIKK